METEKLYYEDCHIRQFDAVVMECEKKENGYAVILNRTAFYPEGGGQACDLGILGNVQVLDVQERDGKIVHTCDDALAVGQAVTGTLDWERRFDLMQQHTGEHILSGLIYEQFGYHNSGFHVGTELMEVDFDGPIPPEAIWELERCANALVWKNLPVHCSYPAEEALKKMLYRTKRALPWPVRIVEIPGADCCACCGVHTKFTGEVGLIKIVSCTKFHSGVRLEMVCGQRAYRYMQNIFLQNRQVSQTLSAPMTETAVAVEKLSAAYAGEKFRAAGLEKKVFAYIARSYQGKVNVLHFAAELSGGGVRELADRIADVCEGYAVVCAGDDETGYGICIVSRNLPVKELGAQAMQALCGRGGGREPAFQGTVKAERKAIEAFFG